MIARRLSTWLTAFAFLTSCGGSGGGSPPPPPVAVPPPPVDEAMGGLWFGVLNFDMSQTSELAVGVIGEDGRFHFVSAESEIQFAGSQQVDVDYVLGFGRGYAAPGTTWLDSSTVTDLTTDGTVDGRNTFSGTWSTASGESGTFDFFYDTEYEKPSSLAVLEGTWTAYDDMGIAVATFTIDAQGAFTAQNTSGCSSTGQFLIIDASYNAYEVNSTIANCFIAGDYSGLAVLGDLNATNDALSLAISNDARAIVVDLEK